MTPLGYSWAAGKIDADHTNPMLRFAIAGCISDRFLGQLGSSSSIVFVRATLKDIVEEPPCD